MKRIVVGEKMRVGRWVADRIKRSAPWGAFEAIGLEKDGELIAGMVVDSYIKDARCCVHLAGDGKRWLNREFIEVCCHYMFDPAPKGMGCKVIIGLVDSDNAEALKFDIDFGFTEKTRIPNGAGECDLVVLILQREDCRWLELKRGSNASAAET